MKRKETNFQNPLLVHLRDQLERFIEELSEFIAATGKVYANHVAAVRMWAQRDRKGTGKNGIPDYSYKEGESL